MFSFVFYYAAKANEELNCEVGTEGGFGTIFGFLLDSSC